MERFVRFIDKIFGRTCVHLITPEKTYIKKHIDFKNIPREGEIIYFGRENYEVSRVLHNYENFRHSVLVVLIPLLSENQDI